MSDIDDRPDRPPSPFAAPAPPPEDPGAEEVVVEDLGYSPEELSPDAAGVRDLMAHWADVDAPLPPKPTPRR